MNLFRISHFDLYYLYSNSNLPLIKRVAQTGKPMIVSTGMANLSELDDWVRTARMNGCSDLTLLKCTSSYPAEPAGLIF